MSSLRSFALPAIGLVVIAVYWLWRSGAPQPVPIPPSERDDAHRSSPGVEKQRASTERTLPHQPATPQQVARRKDPRHRRADRERADAVRQQLRDRRSVSNPAASRPPSEATLDAEYIQERIQKDLVPIADECYEAALDDAPALAGKLVLNFTITGDPSVGGVVDAVEVAAGAELTDEALVECVRESMYDVAFPPPERGGTLSVTYPFVFEPHRAKTSTDETSPP